MYYNRLIDSYLLKWASHETRKPLLLRGARQVGKSTAVRQLSARFEYYIEVNFEKQPEYKTVFQPNLDVKRIVSQIAALSGITVEQGKTLLFLDEIQSCPEAIMALRFFKEDMPRLHVVAAGSLLEFALEELPTFGVGRIHSMFMHPMTFDEFLEADGGKRLLQARNQASPEQPLPKALHDKLVEKLRIYMLVGGMPEVVDKWVATHDFLQCQEIQDDILLSYEDDFAKYRKKVAPQLLRRTLRSAAVQCTRKFVYSQVGEEYKQSEVKKALEMLQQAGILLPVTRTAANGLPLGSGADSAYRKMLLFDTGLMLRLLHMTLGAADITLHILTSNAAELVNKGPVAELTAGLEMFRYSTPDIRNELFYWQRSSKNSQAEVDYLTTWNATLLPVEVKAGSQGGMKSLWMFMREKQLTRAVRCSLENFGTLTSTDAEAGGAERRVTICPLYALSMLPALLRETVRP